MTTLERVRAEIQKVLDKERDFTSENAKAQAIALNWVLALFDKYAEQEPTDTWSIKDVADTFKKHGLIREQEPCDDVVRREDAIHAFDYLMGLNRAQIQDILFKLPSVRPQEPKTGHWILDETDNSITCDKCGCLIWANDISNGEAYYCPNCGARMVEPQESEE